MSSSYGRQAAFGTGELTISTEIDEGFNLLLGEGAWHGDHGAIPPN